MGGYGQCRHDESAIRTASGRWRLVYKTEPGDAGKNGVSDIVVRSKDNPIVTAAYNLQGGTDGVVTIKGEQTAEYFLEVKSFGPRWRVAVERE